MVCHALCSSPKAPDVQSHRAELLERRQLRKNPRMSAPNASKHQLLSHPLSPSDSMMLAVESAKRMHVVSAAPRPLWVLDEYMLTLGHGVFQGQFGCPGCIDYYISFRTSTTGPWYLCFARNT